MTSNLVHFIQSPETPFRKKARELAEKYPTLEEAKVRVKTFVTNASGFCFLLKILGRKPIKTMETSRCFYFFRITFFFFFKTSFLFVGKIASSWAPKFGITTWLRGFGRGLVDEYVAFARGAERCFHRVRGPGTWATKRTKRSLKRKLL